MSKSFAWRPGLRPLAAGAVLALPMLALAQTAPLAPAPGGAGQAPAITAPAAAPLPPALAGLGLGRVTQRTGPEGGRWIEGRTADGTTVTAMVAPDGTLRRVQSRRVAPLPAAVVDVLLTPAMRAEPMLARLTAIESIAQRGDRVVAMGEDAAGTPMRLAFDAATGALVQMVAGDEARRGARMDGDDLGRGRGSDADEDKDDDGDYGHGRREGRGEGRGRDKGEGRAKTKDRGPGEGQGQGQGRGRGQAGN